MSIQRAIISVTDKTGIIEFAKELVKVDVENISTGGTANILGEGGGDVIEIAEYTGFPEILDGRVKTLHPMVHGGILSIRGEAEHERTLEAQGIKKIDLIVVNLYRFEDTISKEGVTLKEAIENIDIGGPTLIRSGAKNFKDVTVIVDPSDYSLVIQEMKEKDGDTSLETRFYLAKKVFEITSSYDKAIINFLNSVKLKDNFEEGGG